jgi:RNA polymerase sigma-70 factor (ECF subfamily)
MTDWAEIVRRHGPLVWRTAWRLLSCDADAADCFQRTFVSAVELAGSEDIHNWPGVLKRLATARALEQLRRRCREAARMAPLPDDPPADGRARDPLAAAAAGELAGKLREALATIDPQQAQVFCLACLEDWSYREIAGQLDITVNHVGVLLNRARAALRARLEAFRPALEAEPNPEGRT